MKIFLTCAFLILATNSFAEAELGKYNEKKEFDQYSIYSNVGGEVVVEVDYEQKKVDCHGLNQKYYRDTLSNGETLITIQALGHSMQMCDPGTDFIAMDGIKFTILFEESYGGTKTLLVPANSKVMLSK